jgi:hypothetical protein
MKHQLICTSVEVRRTPSGPRNPREHSERTLVANLTAYIKNMTGPQIVGTDLDLAEWGNEPISRNVEKVHFAECGELLVAGSFKQDLIEQSQLRGRSIRKTTR